MVVRKQVPQAIGQAQHVLAHWNGGNDALTSLTGLDDITTVGAYLRIYDNAQLPQCRVDEWVAGDRTYDAINDVTSDNDGDNAACD